MKGFINSKVYINGKFVNKVVGFNDGKIAYIGEDKSVIDQVIDKDFTDCLVAPGFIDEHIHGAGNSDAMDATKEDFETISKYLAKEGTTSFLLTTMTDSVSNIKTALTNANEYISGKDFVGARAVGVHLEGPFINAKKCGAQPLEYILPLQKEQFEQFEKITDKIKIVSLAPEMDKTGEFVKYVKSKNITVSVGHTLATYEEFKTAVNNGVTCTTHTYNAMSPLSHREVGVTGGAMIENVYNELICDGIHVGYPAITLLFNNKKDKIILITDSMRAKGIGDGVSSLAGQTVYVKNGEARLADGTLAGSVLTMDKAVKNLVNNAKIDLETVIKCATENPAKNIGLFAEIGSIDLGKNADFVVLDKNLDVKETIVAGKTVYKA